jgi:hypothetical protein
MDGRPYTDADLEMMTDIPAAVFKELFQVAASEGVDWLRIPQGYCADTTGADGAIYSDSDSDSDSNSNSTPPEGVAVVLPFDSEAFRDAWITWERHRKEIKKKLTPSTIEKQLAAIAKMGEAEAIEAINNSVEKGYTGIFPPSGGAQQNQAAKVRHFVH